MHRTHQVRSRCTDFRLIGTLLSRPGVSHWPVRPMKHVVFDLVHLEDCILVGKDPGASATHARRVNEIIEKNCEFARTAKAIELHTNF